jgi:PTS system mannose-specific IIB component/fructoselysine and glucoselysine-specific PTS system IIB component
VDDRLIHGQVVVGWGQPLNARFIVLIDDEVRESEWEQDLYRMGVPEGVEVIFTSVEEAASRIPEWEQDPRPGIVLMRSIGIAESLLEHGAMLRRLNIGGIHHQAGRRERLRYVYLSEDEAEALRGLAARGVRVEAQDVPTARPVSLGDLV